MSARFRKRGGGSANASTGRASRGGKIAAGSLAATVVGAVVRDLSRPNSLIRGLITTAREKLLARRVSRTAIDIGDSVEVEIANGGASRLDAEKDKNNSQEV